MMFKLFVRTPLNTLETIPFYLEANAREALADQTEAARPAFLTAPDGSIIAENGI